MSCAARLGRGSSGLHGMSEENATVAKDFKIFYEKVPGKNAGSRALPAGCGCGRGWAIPVCQY